MRIRHDAVAAASILFTIALVMRTPKMKGWADSAYQAKLSDLSMGQGDQVVMPNYLAPIGFASLAVIATGLIVTWAGYFKRTRWTWFVMFAVVWLWEFPVWILPYYYPWRSTVSLAQMFAPSELIRLFQSAISEKGLAREYVEDNLTFLLMVVALLLPIKTFLGGPVGGPEKSRPTNLVEPHRAGSHPV